MSFRILSTVYIKQSKKENQQNDNKKITVKRKYKTSFNYK